MRSCKIMLLAAILMLLPSGLAFSQVSTGTISGTVQDSSGAVLPGVQVSIVSEGTGISRTVETDANGHYTAPALGLGTYRVTGTREGFQTEIRSGIDLTVGREAVVDLSLSVGATTQQIEVQGEAPLVETTQSSLGALVDERTIRELPLNGRSYDQLALIQPSVILMSPGGVGGAPFAFGSGKRFSVGGSRDVANSFLLDGMNANDQGNGTPGGAAGTNLGVDTILEFKIFTNSFKAEFGHSSGSVTTAVTRSGTNGFHGTGFEYIRNSALDARNPFDPPTIPAFRRNQFGGVLGGPVIKDKTFFFVGFEGLRQGLATTLTAIVPNSQGRQGILPCVINTTTCLTGTTMVTVNPAMQPYINLYPLPNSTIYTDGTGIFLSTPTVPTNENNVMARVDHKLTANTTLFGRYIYDADSVDAQQTLPTVALDLSSRRQYATGQATTVIGSKAVNNARLGFERMYSIYDPEISSSVPASLSIIPGQELGALQIGAVVGPGSRVVTPLGSPNTGSSTRYWAYNVFEGADDFSYIVGKHSLKAGVDVMRFDDNTQLGQYARGGYTFPSFATFLEGLPSSLTAAAPLGVLPTWGLRQTLFGVYGEDDYTVNSRLTLNLGLRYEITTDPTDADGHASVLPSLSSSAMVASNTYFSTGKKNFEPRVGLAWRLDGSGKTVVRAAFGIYHDQLLPFAYALNISNPPFYGRYNASNPPFPNGYTVLKPGALLALTTESSLMKTPAANQYNMSIERQLSAKIVLEVNYAGDRADHLETEREANSTIPTFLNGNPATPFYPAGTPRQNTNFASNEQLNMNGNSHYDAGTVILRRQSTSGFQGQVFYTFSRSDDDSSNVSGSDSVRSPQLQLNPWDLAQDWGLSDFDVRHHLGFNFSYPIPVKVKSAYLGAVVNGWTFDGIGTFSTGQPFTARLSTAISNDQSGTLAERPNLNAGFSSNPIHGVSAGCTGIAAGTPVGTPQNWYDPCAFSAPTAGTYGDVPRNSIIGPKLADVDAALEKIFKIREAASVTFRAEMFNIANHPNYGLPTAAALGSSQTPSPSGGLITATLTTSRQLQFGLRVSF